MRGLAILADVIVLAAGLVALPDAIAATGGPDWAGPHLLARGRPELALLVGLGLGWCAGRLSRGRKVQAPPVPTRPPAPLRVVPLAELAAQVRPPAELPAGPVDLRHLGIMIVTGQESFPEDE